MSKNVICQVSPTSKPDLYFVENSTRPYFVGVNFGGNETIYRVEVEAMIRLRNALNTAIKEAKS